MRKTPKRQRVSTSTNKLHELNPEERMKILQEIDRKTSYRKIAEQSDIAISTVSKIVKDRERIETEASNTPNLNQKRPPRAAKFDDINKCTLEFFRQVRAQNLTISGSMIQERAVYYAESFGAANFAASSGWPQSFPARNSIDLHAMLGESADNDLAAGEGQHSLKDCTGAWAH